MSTTRRVRQRRRTYTEYVDGTDDGIRSLEGTSYLKSGGEDFDRRAHQLDQAATAWLRSKGAKGRTHEPPNDREDRRRYRAEGRPDLRPGRTLTRGGGTLRPGART